MPKFDLPRYHRLTKEGMSALRCFAHKDATVPANTSWYVADLGEFRGMQERYTRQNTTMTESPACSTSDRFAETSRLNAASKNSVPYFSPYFSVNPPYRRRVEGDDGVVCATPHKISHSTLKANMKFFIHPLSKQIGSDTRI